MKLPRAVKDKSGKTLRTTDEAKRYVLGKLKTRPGYKSWKHAAELLVEGAAAERIAKQLELRCCWMANSMSNLPKSKRPDCPICPRRLVALRGARVPAMGAS